MESYAVNSYKQGMSRTSSLERSTRVSCRFKEVPGVALAPAACKRKGRNFRSGQENGNELNLFSVLVSVRFRRCHAMKDFA